MAFGCRHSKRMVALVLLLLLTATAAITGLGVMGTILVLAYLVAAGMLIGLFTVALTKEGY